MTCTLTEQCRSAVSKFFSGESFSDRRAVDAAAAAS